MRLDALDLAAILAVLVAGMVVIVDINANGRVDPAVLAMFVSIAAPLTPAMVVRHRARKENGKP